MRGPGELTAEREGEGAGVVRRELRPLVADEEDGGAARCVLPRCGVRGGEDVQKLVAE